MFKWLRLSSEEKEELRKLRVKCKYQEEWISSRLGREKKPDSEKVKQLKQVNSTLQRRISRVQIEEAEIFAKYFATGCDK